MGFIFLKALRSLALEKVNLVSPKFIQYSWPITFEQTMNSLGNYSFVEHNWRDLLSVVQYFHMHYAHLILRRSKQVFIRKTALPPGAAVAGTGTEKRLADAPAHAQRTTARPSPARP